MTTSEHQVAIVGTGPAGLTAAIYAARAGLSPIVFGGLLHGGQLTTTTDVENFPGFAEGVMGPELMQNMTKQAERVGARVIYDEVSEFSLDGADRVLKCSDHTYRAKAVIIATGATALTLGLPGEAALMGRGLSTCATCDGFFYKAKTVAVVGGGDSAMEEASYLSKLCAKVYLIHRRDSFKASKIMVERVRGLKQIETLVPYEITETLSDAQGLRGIKLRHLKEGSIRELSLDGLFYAIGHRPNSKLFKDYVDLDANGYIKTLEFTKTKTPGLFAAGDIADPHFRQAITAAGMGCQAAIQAQHYLEGLH